MMYLAFAWTSVAVASPKSAIPSLDIDVAAPPMYRVSNPSFSAILAQYGSWTPGATIGFCFQLSSFFLRALVVFMAADEA